MGDASGSFSRDASPLAPGHGDGSSAHGSQHGKPGTGVATSATPAATPSAAAKKRAQPVDGDCSDWDASGSFHVAADARTAARGASSSVSHSEQKSVARPADGSDWDDGSFGASAVDPSAKPKPSRKP